MKMQILRDVGWLLKPILLHPTPGIWNLLILCRSFWAIQPRSSWDDRSPKTTILAWTAPLPASRDTTGWQFPTIPSPTKSYCPSQKQGAPHQCNCKRWQRLVCDINILQWVFFFLIIIYILCLFDFFTKLHTIKPHEINIIICIFLFLWNSCINLENTFFFRCKAWNVVPKHKTLCKYWFLKSIYLENSKDFFENFFLNHCFLQMNVP